MEMNMIRRSFARFGPVFLVIAVQGALLSGPNVASSAVVPETPFATVVEPIGVAATPAGFGYVTRPLCTSEANPTRQVAIFDSTGSVIRRLAIPNLSETVCRELYIAVAPGPADNTVVAGYPTANPAGFTSNELYVSDGATILVFRLKKNPNGSVALNPDGSPQFLAPATFATLPSCGSSRTGLTFDETSEGAFGNKLIATCSTGEVWRLNADGSIAGEGALVNIATTQEVSGPFEGPVVASEGPFEGNLLVAAENAPVSCGTDGPFRLVQAARFGAAVVVCPPNGEVFEVSPAGTVTPIADVPSAEGVTVIPTNKCTLGLTAGFTYFTAIFKPAGAGGPGGTIDQLPRGAFAGLGGKALVTSEAGETGIGIAQVSSPGVVTKFRDFFAQHQGSAFVDCLVPVLVKIRVIRHDTTVTVRIFSDRNFFSGNLIPSTALFGPYTSGPGAPAIRCKLAKKRGEGGGGGDSNVNQTGQNENQRGESDDEDENAGKGISTCTFPNNLAPGQLGVIKFKYNDPAGPGDGDGEGGG